MRREDIISSSSRGPFGVVVEGRCGAKVFFLLTSTAFDKLSDKVGNGQAEGCAYMLCNVSCVMYHIMCTDLQLVLLDDSPHRTIDDNNALLVNKQKSQRAAVQPTNLSIAQGAGECTKE